MFYFIRWEFLGIDFMLFVEMLLVLEIIVGVYILWFEIVIFNELLWRISIDLRVW